ncbi:hypothetical protein GYMLUDRAFT_64385 [Collybiopsis luxurians FD-317 M1]|uniref:DH domain-containing protein n=1 Tax=Collybiopsis luxurians FD-317 M1 TaxID=944289 RepID=A0A0D0BRB4_9AGAR|nr:hypothetical protein GYMLUDRAFT_64385 [Collybiopsis luxurians FD-317 M1]
MHLSHLDFPAGGPSSKHTKIDESGPFTCPGTETGSEAKKPWKDNVPEEVLNQIGEVEVKRQVVIHNLVAKEMEYLEQLVLLESDFLRPLTEWVTEKEKEKEREQGAGMSTGVDPAHVSLLSFAAAASPLPTPSMVVSSSGSSGLPLSLSSSVPLNHCQMAAHHY